MFVDVIYTGQPSAHVSILSDDVLHSIFSLNTQTAFRSTSGNLTAFMTLLETSRVCSSWRHIVTTSSTLWAREVNLQFLRNREGKEEGSPSTDDAASLNITAHTN